LPIAAELEAADAGIFFGREAPTIEALDRIRGMKEGAAPRLLVVLGASGAGKSSFLRAGLLPRLGRDDRNYVTLPVMRPEKAVISGEAGLFLADGAAESAALLALLHDLLVDDTLPLLVLVTLRSDSFEQLQTTNALEGIPQQPLSLSPMPRGAYQAVIEGPVARLNESDRSLTIEPALTQALLSDIEDSFWAT
jgi:hypothetical protein